MRAPPLLPSPILIIALLAPLPAQARWQRVWPPSLAPSPRYDHAMAFDGAAGLVLLHGGEQVSGILDDFWQFDGATWSQLATGPSPRRSHAMAYDRVRHRIVMFGGNGPNTQFDETWEWDGSSWTLRSFALRPPGRASAVMAFDPVRALVVLFGGSRNGVGDLGDLWEYDGASWQLRTPASGPSPRSGAAMAFDPATRTMLLFGGAGNMTLDDTWQWDGSAWQQRFPATPPGVRANARMVTDEARARVVLVGSPTGDPYAWEWDGSEWTQQFQTSPAPRTSPGLAYDSVRREVVLFGGYDWGVGYLGDTWVYRTAHPASFTPYGSGCPGSAGTPELVNAPYSLPWLGDTFRTRVTASSPASSAAIFVTGIAATPATSLAVHGLPGCDGFVDPVESRFGTFAGGIAEWSVAVPPDPVLAGAQLFQQALVLDAVNPAGAVVSNAGEIVAGIR